MTKRNYQRKFKHQNKLKDNTLRGVHSHCFIFYPSTDSAL